MCRYAISGPYKPHFACFACRKAFKQQTISDWLSVRGRGFAYDSLALLWSHKRILEQRELELGVRLADLENEYRSAAHKCPQCGVQMVDMGLDFKPPRQSDEKAWRNLLGLYHVGVTFHTCGCYGAGFIPKSNADYRSFLEGRLQMYLHQLDLVQKSTELGSEAKQESGAHWLNCISQVELELAKLIRKKAPSIESTGEKRELHYSSRGPE